MTCSCIVPVSVYQISMSYIYLMLSSYVFQTVDYSYIVRMDGRDLSFTRVFPMLSFNALYPLIILTRQDERQRLILDTFRSLTILLGTILIYSTNKVRRTCKILSLQFNISCCRWFRVCRKILFLLTKFHQFLFYFIGSSMKLIVENFLILWVYFLILSL